MESSTETTEKINPYTNIWLRPRKTFIYLLPRFMEKHVVALAAIFGFLHILHQAAQDGQGDFIPLELIFLIALIVGPLGGYAIVYVVSTYIGWVFSWFKLQVASRDVRIVLAWSLLPYILSLVLFVPFMLIYGQNWFESTVSISSSVVIALIPLLSNLQYLLIGWSLVILLVGLATISGATEAKSLLLLFVATGVIAIPLLLIVLLLPGL